MLKSRAVCCWVSGLACEIAKQICNYTQSRDGNSCCCWNNNSNNNWELILLSQKTLFFLSSCWGLSIKISCSGGCCCLSLAMTRASLWRVCVRVLEMSKRWKVNIGHEYWSICVGYANFFGRPFSTLLSIIMNFGSCLRHRYFFLCKLIYYEFIDLSWI